MYWLAAVGDAAAVADVAVAVHTSAAEVVVAVAHTLAGADALPP